MINYKVFQVGDALLSVLLNRIENTAVEYKSIFDFGYSNAGLFRGVNSSEYSDSKTLLISHFHRDHFNGLSKINDKSLGIESLIIPKLPFDALMAIGIKSFVAIQLFYLAEKTGFYETDVLNIIKRKNRINFIVNRRRLNDSFMASNIEFDVIWPDPMFISNIPSVKIAVTNIAIILEENDEFNTFYNEVLESDFLNEEIDNVVVEELDELRPFQIKLTKSQRLLLKNANARLINVANDNCLAFQNIEYKFLSLGDLSRRALWNLFDAKFQNPFKYEIILSAHHGTHFTNHANWHNVKSCVVAHSNGLKMRHYYRNEYACFSNQHHQSHNSGLFESRPYVRHCRLEDY
ncbi:hypothetical protein [Flavobacterium tegetincola]|uniref:hypothetical protein n=1 Tax=Flavobacterium tegetincola TaxID=150172 RepID=UPI00042903B3|nr:hypothetical protein [Flavobacterium tegetincola]